MAEPATRKIGSDMKPKRAGNRGLGRPKGARNKTTTAVKEMILAALDQAGGVDYLVEQADKNPSAFLTLVGKVLPMQVDANVNGAIGLLPAKVDDLV